MLIPLDKIKPSPNPIRSSWNEDKMQELVQSIQEQGLIVPIKARPNGDCYEVIYGHRRVEACRRAGLAEIECIVERLIDTDVLIQSWIENVQREDMSALDRARALRSIQKATGWSQAEMDRRGIANNATISHLLLYLKEYEQGAIPSIDRRPDSRDEGVIRAKHIRTAFNKVGIDDAPLKRRVHEHTANLPREKVREVAEAVAHAEDEAEREAILTTDPKDPMFDQLVKVRTDLHREKAKQERKKREDEPREVRVFLDSVRSFYTVIRQAEPVVEYGKFSPEAKRFAIRQLDQLAEAIQVLRKKLEE